VSYKKITQENKSDACFYMFTHEFPELCMFYDPLGLLVTWTTAMGSWSVETNNMVALVSF